LRRGQIIKCQLKKKTGLQKEHILKASSAPLGFVLEEKHGTCREEQNMNFLWAARSMKEN
jgi:hypothetical protein